MLNEEKVILMTQMASYEENEGKKNMAIAFTYAGIPLGSLLAALLGIFLLPVIGWRGMFLLGALPLVTLLPLAIWKLPESVAWLASLAWRRSVRSFPRSPS